MPPEQSPPVDPREAFEELARLSLRDESVDSVLQRVTQLAQRSIHGAAEVSVTLVSDHTATTAAFSGRVAAELDETQYDAGRGPCMEAAIGGEVVEVPDFDVETRWPELTTAALKRGLHGSLSTPIPVQVQLQGAVNIYSAEPHAFDDDDREMAKTFASYAAVAIANMHLYENTRALAENLQKAMEYRAVIEQAKGILMSQRRISAAEAFELLSAASQRSNRKLRDIAAAIVAGIEDGH
ncbi:GAF and ANTAR domain-containing protein [Blastococcus sp. URHD0036]|uniref:GAF and ANTAR domain-containing protein n=1 Tax=Blastococcus sp. URHD0036 TaxID=1380356 RepID=UPI000497E52B|nr:GAF and ANTAR domain-containing protein [Blastococcus sp. URHD0036]